MQLRPHHDVDRRRVDRHRVDRRGIVSGAAVRSLTRSGTTPPPGILGVPDHTAERYRPTGRNKVVAACRPISPPCRRPSVTALRKWKPT